MSFGCLSHLVSTKLSGSRFVTSGSLSVEAGPNGRSRFYNSAVKVAGALSLNSSDFSGTPPGDMHMVEAADVIKVADCSFTNVQTNNDMICECAIDSKVGL